VQRRYFVFISRAVRRKKTNVGVKANNSVSRNKATGIWKGGKANADGYVGAVAPLATALTTPYQSRTWREKRLVREKFLAPAGRFYFHRKRPLVGRCGGGPKFRQKIEKIRRWI